MKLTVKDSVRQGDALVSRLYIDDQIECFILEDWEEGVEHRIPRGTYPLAIRTEGLMHGEYSKRFPAIHKGMIQVLVPGRRWILIHIGNSPADTLGCSLTGTTNIGFGKVEGSTAAYLKLYPKLIGPLLKGEKLTITYEPIVNG